MLNRFKTYQLNLRGREVTIERPWVMGILNVTPDSFYAESRRMTEQGLQERVEQMVTEGADMIDVGAYSTRPGAAVVEPEEEILRLSLALEVVKRVSPDVYVSVDTFRSRVAQLAVEEFGVDVINDVSGGTLDPEMSRTVARLHVPAVVMHMRGTPATMQQLSQYDNVVGDVLSELAQTIALWRQAGVTQIIADPGFGFSKTLDQNYELLSGLEAFHSLEVPLLVGVSRKSMIYKALGCTPQDALNGTVVINTLALLQGAHILRVHDVRAAVEACTLIETLNRNNKHSKLSL
ncbi:MAG: dihydropteroate synthase [Muribaculaceae bacterium]|nr:dihydropteroate synthase [Muribaculaceae bacterium]